ncbi:Major egg antigen [Echinococcus granulosus]|uniref:Major egg antigen n=1 Tax=Echinococcus granulosus TaxID=6210 RepID=A0A068WNU0_ECHGR|nr:Major egg antigen [Echinococcus granulosus]CDS20164.1 major egg antigen [Echinococcus granulosus]
MEIPVRRGHRSGDRQLAVRHSSGDRDTSHERDFPICPFTDLNRQFDTMERQLADFKPFDVFPSFGGSAGPWFTRINNEMRRVHNEMMNFMRDSGMQSNFDDFWRFPSIKDCFSKDENGQTWFRAKFDLQAFNPEDIEVKVENQTLSVHAKHTQRGNNSSSGQYFCRAMLLPDGVCTEEIKSKLDKNGVLTVEAPAPGIEVERLSPSRSTRIPIEEGGRRRRFYDRSVGRLRPKHRKAREEYVREDQNGLRSLHITLPIDGIYEGNHLHIQCSGGKLVVEGERDDSYFSRSFHVPSDIDPESLDAKLCNGVLTITGPIP